MKTEYRYHPDIPGLKVNEDGSEVLLNDLPLEVKMMKNVKHPYHYFYYKGFTINLAKAVLECWKGLSPERRYIARHINGDYENYHYTNLQWGNRGGNGKYPAKLNPEQTKNILERLAAGERGSDLAREHGVTRTAISNLKNKSKK